MLLQCFFVAVLVFQACMAQNTTGECSNVIPGEFSFHVSILCVNSTWAPKCFGAILDETTILTTAYCCLCSGSLNVIAGTDSFQEDESSYQESPVSEVRIHEGYENGFSPYDICILKLATRLEFNKYVSSVGLPYQNEVATGNGELCVWNATAKNISLSSVDLQKVTVPVLDRDCCLKRLEHIIIGQHWTLYPEQMCTDNIRGQITCGVNPGSLLVQIRNVSDSSPGNKTDILIGIFAWGAYLYPADILPAVFVRISSFVDWIYLNWL